MWIIRDASTLEADEQPLYWSNTTGWVSRNSADIFTDEEREHLHLPLDGEWEMSVDPGLEADLKLIRKYGGED